MAVLDPSDIKEFFPGEQSLNKDFGLREVGIEEVGEHPRERRPHKTRGRAVLFSGSSALIESVQPVVILPDLRFVDSRRRRGLAPDFFCNSKAARFLPEIGDKVQKNLGLYHYRPVEKRAEEDRVDVRPESVCQASGVDDAGPGILPFGVDGFECFPEASFREIVGLEFGDRDQGGRRRDRAENFVAEFAEAVVDHVRPPAKPP